MSLAAGFGPPLFFADQEKRKGDGLIFCAAALGGIDPLLRRK
jgi:hypothetical protein